MDNSRATVEAFYARVINRVCHSYQQSSDAISEADTERLQQVWLDPYYPFLVSVSYSSVEEMAGKVGLLYWRT